MEFKEGEVCDVCEVACGDAAASTLNVVSPIFSRLLLKELLRPFIRGEVFEAPPAPVVETIEA